MMAVFAVAAWPILATVTVQPGGLHRHGGPRVVELLRDVLGSADYLACSSRSFSF